MWWIIAVVLILITISVYRGRPDVNQPKKKIKSRPPLPEPSSIESQVPDTPVPFGYKCVWMAISTNEIESVAQALRLTEVSPCNWKVGIANAYGDDRWVFVSPPVREWVLAVGFALPTNNGPKFSDELTPLLERLGQQFSDVQHFGTHRIVDYHSWYRVIDGKVVRGFAYLGESGETFSDIGQMDTSEQQLRTKNLEKWKKRRDPDPDEEYQFFAFESDVMRMATSWSVDPTQLDKLELQPGIGLLGRLPK